MNDVLINGAIFDIAVYVQNKEDLKKALKKFKELGYNKTRINPASEIWSFPDNIAVNMITKKVIWGSNRRFASFTTEQFLDKNLFFTNNNK